MRFSRSSPATIDLRRFCESLYCAYAPADAFTATSDDVIAFAAVDHSIARSYNVEFTGVRGLRRERDRGVREAQPGDALELSVIELERESEGWRVWFNPWYVEEIEFHCDRIILDGVEVKGTGRWLQDDLPKRPAW